MYQRLAAAGRNISVNPGKALSAVYDVSPDTWMDNRNSFFCCVSQKKYQQMYIVGINAAFHDSSACIIKDGQLLAAAEEERFTHI